MKEQAILVDDPQAHPEAIQAGRAALFGQVIRFSIVGMVNLGVDLSVLNLLILLEPSGSSGVLYSVFKTISFLAAVTNSYLLNRRFTFNTRKAVTSGQVTGFLIISIGGMLINVGIATAIVNFVPAPEVLAPHWPTIAAIPAVPFGMLWNFIGYRYLIF